MIRVETDSFVIELDDAGLYLTGTNGHSDEVTYFSLSYGDDSVTIDLSSIPLNKEDKKQIQGAVERWEESILRLSIELLHTLRPYIQRSENSLSNIC